MPSLNPSKSFSINWAGRDLTISVGQLAQQANGSCTVRYGDTVILATATLGNAKEDAEYFPLMVDFEERMYAAGRIKGSRFIKREGRPTDEAILSGRLIDRAIRPLFSDTLRNEVAVIATVFSHDQVNDADIPGLIGASCALAISDIPWAGPIAAIRIGRRDGKFIVMPTYEETLVGDLDLVVAGTAEKTLMVEAGAAQLSDADMLEAMKLAHAHLSPVIDLIHQVREAVGKTKLDPTAPKDAEDAEKKAKRKEIADKALAFLSTQRGVLFAEPLKSKADRKAAVGRLKKALAENLAAIGIGKDDLKKAESVLDGFVDSEVTKLILDEKRRADGRELHEVRSLGSMVGLIPRTHGSGLFERGSTQVLTAVTLGSPGMEQTLDTMEFQTTKRYFHHYNFPGYSVGEAKSNRGPGRREIGHGALAERALLDVLPSKDEFPYTIRVVSEVLGSNGSSSMGATCGSTLALMDAGVPIKEPVAGIAMGVASDEATGRFQVITDLQDLEDGTGGMDFKIAGTKNGITAVQMDTKTHGIPWHVVEETIARARDARLHILKSMLETLPAVRSELSPFAPRIESFKINPDKIREVIGPGGKMINEIIATYNVEIDIADDGTVSVTSNNAENMAGAVNFIKSMTREIEVGEIFEGTVVRMMDFGAFVNIAPKVDGLVHVSEMKLTRVEKPTDVVNIGDKVRVVAYEIDDKGRINLSMKRLDPEYKPSDKDTKPLRRK
ncbi:MAG: polyribonucleotide nucleotidyltransferase [Candidatus Magasanikbacteria bacterium]|nr:polyribonucleotide nucleotidyltransferase [Candidatus Magasanikbacteria bacterium]